MPKEVFFFMKEKENMFMFDPDKVVIGDGSAGRFISILVMWFITTIAVIVGGLLWWMVA